MPHSEPEQASASALLLTWLCTPLIAIGIGFFAGALAFAGSLAALCSSMARMFRPRRRRVAPARVFAPFMPLAFAPVRRRRLTIDRAPR